MDLAGTLDHGPAEIVLAVDLLPLPLARQHIALHVGTLVERVEPSGEIVIMLRRVRAHEAAATLVTTVNLLALDQGLEKQKRLGRILKHGSDLARPCVAILRPGAAPEPFSNTDAAAHRTAIACARPRAEVGGFENDDIGCVTPQLQRGREPCVTSTNDDDIRFGPGIDASIGCRTPRLPPIGLRLEFGMDDIVVYCKSLSPN